MALDLTLNKDVNTNIRAVGMILLRHL